MLQFGIIGALGTGRLGEGFVKKTTGFYNADLDSSTSLRSAQDDTSS